MVVATELEKLAADLLVALVPAENASNLNGPAFMVLCMEVEALGIAPRDLTLGMVAELLEATSRRYNRCVVTK